MVDAYIALGANLGDPARQLDAAVDALALLPESRLIAVSDYYRSAPVGYADQPDFHNAVARVTTTLAAPALLDALLGIETGLGRHRSFRNAPRTLDLDLLLYGDATLHLPQLNVPHPRMHERAFVLLPLLEIAPDVVIPGFGPAKDGLAAVAGQAIARIPGSGRRP
ncbi:2-amino-4-hydroxy-6-hydroxymethyldihydropteridine diphosphokinase [Jeongeupia naejangsanensis]|uniref:2-amino-4-hydroxy-6-hydroxymethyldihydropteridine pyrophosphokinase n=1 Tax=Jeongeupia naejangsanensis TaxID=613195 RepID=A0ABS2BPE0_9NEIS|nr:2-amino-4-hydroxy-6-hydroxymethyldihydropteridine diphosphokinase [Jeongeupia naejangsanensis]MBM3117280.1 2-amino-4-hydroxy-6-hydroxymethyldihydropteridine diphosphokinase [Jeongeupia naejangsanensis]